MGVLVHYSSMCYAVIQASSKKGRPERLVIAYQYEDCLRDLIAAPSIIGLGFASREEAIANLEGHMSDAAPSKQKARITAMFHATHANVELAGGHGLVKHRRIPQSILQSALAAVIALFYSKNIVSVMIRMAELLFSCVDHRCLVHLRKNSGKREVRALSRRLNEKPEQEITNHCRR
jgi:hypothetical protein